MTGHWGSLGNWGFMGQENHVLWFDEVGRDDALAVGGKGASLGEMYRNLRESGVDVPNGFCTTSDGYREFVGTEVARGTCLLYTSPSPRDS